MFLLVIESGPRRIANHNGNDNDHDIIYNDNSDVEFSKNEFLKVFINPMLL